MLQKQIINIPVAGGLDTKTDPFLVEAGLALTLENARFQKTGKLSKRYGLVLLSNTTNLGTLSSNTVKFIAADNEYMAAVTDSGVFAYSPGDTKWYKQSSFGVCSKISTEFVMKNYFDQKAVDMDITSDGTHIAYVCRQEKTSFSNNVLIVLEDAVTGLRKTRNILVASSNIGLQRVIVMKTAGVASVHVFYYDGTNLLRDIYDENMDPISSGTTIFACTDASQFDLCKNSTTIFLGKMASTALELRSYNSAGVQQNTASITVTNAIHTVGGFARGMCMIYSGSTLHVSWIRSAGPAIKGFTSALVASVTELTISGNPTKVSIHATTTGLSIMSDTDVAGSEKITHGTLTFTSTYTYTAGATYERVIIAAQSFAIGTKDIVLVKDLEAINSAFYVLNLTDAYMAQVFSPLLAIRNFISGTTAIAMASKSVLLSGVLKTVIPRRIQSSTTDAGEFFSSSGLSLTSHDFTSRVGDGSRFKVGERIYLTEGATLELDKCNPHDNGFVMSPLVTSVTANVSTANPNVASKTFSYCAVYVYRDSSGQITRSAPCLAVSTGGATNANTASISVAFRVPVCSLKSNGSNTRFSSLINIELYRTLTTGSVFYKLFDFYSVNNDGSISSYTDTTADSSLSNNETLYTTGGILPNDPTPTARFSTAGGNRLFLGGLEEKDEIAYSKKQLFGESVAFSDFFRIRISTGGSADKSPLSALGYMDGKLIIFREKSIYCVSGDGPNETGAQDSFTDPESISSDVGCIEPRSVLGIPSGLLFKSRKGIYLLGRGLDITYVGAAVEEFNSQQIVAATLSDKANEARLYTDAGNCLVYNFSFGTWAIHTGQTSVDADSWQNSQVSILANKIYNESESVFTDNSTFYAMKLKTSWIKVSGIQDFGRIWAILILGKFKSAHNLTVKVYYDFDSSTSTTYTVTPSVSDSQYQYRIHLAKQKCEAVQFEIYDSSQVGESMELTALSLEVGLKKGAMKLPAVRKY